MHFLHMSWLEFKGKQAAFKLEEFILLELLYPFLTLIFYCVMVKYANNSSDMTEWIIGNAFFLCTNICIFSLGSSFASERICGRIRAVIVGEVSKIRIILQKGFIPGVVSLGTSYIGFVFGCVSFGISLNNIPWGPLLLAFIVAIFATTCFGVFLATLGLICDQMHLILNLMNYILLFFSGANFSVAQLPDILELISKILPLTRSIMAARAVMDGLDGGVISKLVVTEMLVGIGYIIIAVYIINRAERIAIKKGTLELF